MKKTVSFLCTLMLCFAAASPLAMAAVPNFASSIGHDNGDHLRLTTDVWGFEPVSAAPGLLPGKRCAGKYSTYTRVDSDTTHTYVKFYSVTAPMSPDTCPFPATPAGQATPSKPLQAQEGSLYKIENALYKGVEFKSTGLAFGALVVPFKFRLGNDKKLVSSATIAPFLGVRWSGFQGFGFEFMPIVSAGLGLVPVTDPTTNTTETRSAFSSAVGVTLTSSKNADFSAGLVIGKDYLNKADRIADPSVNKAWISIWLGISK